MFPSKDHVCPTGEQVDALTDRVEQLEQRVEQHKTLHADTTKLLEEVKKSMDALSAALTAQQDIMAEAKALLEGYQKLRGAWSLVGMAGEGMKKIATFIIYATLLIALLRWVGNVDTPTVVKMLTTGVQQQKG